MKQTDIETNMNVPDVKLEEAKLQKRKIKQDEKNMKPILKVCKFGESALLSVKENDRKPIFLQDLQHLLMQALMGKHSPCYPIRWSYLEKYQHVSHTVVLCIEGFSLPYYTANESKFEKANEVIKTKFEVYTPNKRAEPMNMIEDFVEVLLLNADIDKLIEEHGSLQAVVNSKKDPVILIKEIYPINDPLEVDVDYPLHENETFERRKLLLSIEEMATNNFPVPFQRALKKELAQYKPTKTRYDPVSNLSPLFCVKCEMCLTTSANLELTKIIVINEKFETVYQSLVKPNNEIVDYLTEFSKLNEEVMSNVTTTLNDVQSAVTALLPSDAILVGHSLNHDLNAMQMTHPYIIDTSLCFNRSSLPEYKSKLSTLTELYLNKILQKNVNDKCEDALEHVTAILSLLKMKLTNSMEFGDVILMRGKQLHNVIQEASGGKFKNYRQAHVEEIEKRAAIVSNKLPLEVKKKVSTSDKIKLFEITTKDLAVKKCIEISKQNSVTICHICVSLNELNANLDPTITNIDRWIMQIWKSMKKYGFLFVIMGGAQESSGTLAKAAIKYTD